MFVLKYNISEPERVMSAISKALYYAEKNNLREILMCTDQKHCGIRIPVECLPVYIPESRKEM